MIKFIAGLLIAFNAVSVTLSSEITPLPDKVACVVADRQDFQIPDRVQLTGWLGTRIAANEGNRLALVDTDRLLEGYRKRPGRQTWDGEHVGKWLHAATLAWVNSGDPALRAKLDETAAELCKCQLEDGYLGTYLEKDRWTRWDVWAHKYNLIGLMTYVRYTGNLAPLSCCRRMGDLLCNTFGDEPGQRDIINGTWHVGMAPTSVLEPMVLLYRLTGEKRYLDFCNYILRAWEQPNGPKIISTLLTQKRVEKVANGKAYEMLSCLNGTLEYYRTVGDPKILEACLNAWKDIVENRLYLTGAATSEYFRDDLDLPNAALVGETCVTVTWIQFNAQLLRLTGEARFAEHLEYTVFNQLFGAQKCDGSAWCNTVRGDSKKPYASALDGNCCLSSGPRGVALIPTFAVSTDAAGAVVNLYDAGTAKLTLKDQTAVTLAIATRYPADEQIRITVGLAGDKKFALKLRTAAWCREPSVQVNGQPLAITPAGPDGYVAVQRSWKDGDEVNLRFKLEPRVVVGDHNNSGKLAVLYGPLLLAADAALLGDQLKGLKSVALPSADLAALAVTPEPAPDNYKTWPCAQVFRVNAVPRQASKSGQPATALPIRLVPFADAGAGGSNFKVWMPIGQTEGNLLLEERESRSRRGNISGSITDGDPKTFVLTFDDKAAAEDWFAVTLAAPAELRRVVFVHGKTFHHGGWFNASAGQPQVQVQTAKKGPWETVGLLRDYPATTATSAAGLNGGERFTCQLSKSVEVYGVRVAGKPASGDAPLQAFASCGELLAE